MIFPTKSVAAELAKDKETLDLSHAGLGEKGSAALAAALHANSNVVKLVLVGNHIRPSSALSIAHAVRDGHSITSLDLSSNRLGEAELPKRGAEPVKGGTVVQELLGVGSNIQELSLRNNSLSDSDVAQFVGVLSDNTVLQQLDLSYNKIGYMGAVQLGQMLGQNGDLRVINFEWNNFRNVGCMKILSDGILNNNTLKTVNLSACGLDDGCAQLVNRVISENAIEEIIIANNRIGPSGGESIAKGLQATSSLQTLILDGNPLSDKGCLALLNVVVQGEARTLQLLSLQQCECSSEVEAQGAAASTGTTKVLISETRSKVTM
ncbi:leucine-richprotein [Angomonas deanei]|nr:leucine-richprotein [Angomonas deanei]|eukprot:EPY35053.1 leucine-richprotein [Angomonas deanei]